MFVQTANLHSLSTQQFDAFIDLYRQHVDHEVGTLMIANEVGRLKDRVSTIEGAVDNSIRETDRIDLELRRLTAAAAGARNDPAAQVDH